MNNTFYILITAIVGFSTRTYSAQQPDSGSNTNQPLQQLLAESNDAAATIADLAVERFQLNQKNGENWIMTTQDATTSVRKYESGGIMLVALPLFRAGPNSGVLRYVTTYNQMVLRKTDTDVSAGSTKNAKLIYRLLLRHNPGGEFVSGLERRVNLLEAYERNLNLEQLQAELRAIEPTYDLFASTSSMGTLKPTEVGDLLEVNPSLPTGVTNTLHRPIRDRHLQISTNKLPTLTDPPIVPTEPNSSHQP
jgi:hypothetical protein